MTPAAPDALQGILAAEQGWVIAFSGGVDSGVLLHAAMMAVGPAAVMAVTAKSPSLPAAELVAAVEFAATLGVDHRVLTTDELSREGYRRNDVDRCYHCKSELFDVLGAAQRSGEIPTTHAVAIGAITDDLGDHRPGARAARERGVRSPLLEAGLDKAAVRAYARRFGLALAEKPASACLASRIAHGLTVDAGLLSRIERGESYLRALGLTQFRLRHHDAIARIEVLPAEFEVVVRDREAVHATLRALGWRFVTIDLLGYRSGSLNPEPSP
ncbi:MAG: ATP-dependent sacrificial sulfur transferase LarE [Planctomycetota bacterium]